MLPRNHLSLALAICAGIVLSGCSVSASSIQAASLSPETSALANGRSIFLTGRDSAGSQIVARRTPLFDNCAACHRADGSGGRRLPGGTISADLRYKALVTNQRHPYTPALIERAVATGIDNVGRPLNAVMPRWRLSQRDLHDVALYVLEKLGRSN